MDDNSEDDGPIIFKRGNNSSKKNQSNPEIKKSPIQKYDGIPAKQVTHKVKTVSSANNASIVPGKKHSTSSANAPPVMTNPKTSTSSANAQAVMANSKTPTSSANHPSAAMTNSKTPTSSANPSAAMTNSKISSSSANTSAAMTNSKTSTSSTNASAAMTNSKISSSSANTSAAMANSKTSTSSANAASAAMTNPKTSTTSANASPMIKNSKPSTSQMNQTTVKEEKPSLKSSDCHSEDSEDDKPLSSRLTSSKGNSNLANKRPPSIASAVGSTPLPKPKVNKYEDDSDDEIPLSAKFPMKSNAAASTSKSYDSDENKPLAAKLQQNGQLKNSSNLSNKRPLGEVKISGQSSVKKTKLTHSSTQNDSKPVAAKPESKSDDDDDVPISQRLKMQPASGNKSSSSKLKVNKVTSTSFKKTSKNFKKVVKKSKYVKSSKVSPGSGEGQKWTTLVHSGVIFPPPYKPHGVKMLYKGQPVDLTPEQEEVATMFAVMIDTEYMTKPKFKENFMNDWRKILGKKHVIQNLEECDFTPIYEWHQREKEKKKQMTTEEKKAIKEEKMKQEEVYMWAVVDGVKEKVGNFRVEPPGLFRGRGEHPKMGKLKRRIRPSDIVINIGKDAPIPECPIAGESWKEIRHDNTVTWLAFWNDPINPKEFKYVFLAASSSLKGQSDKVKYEKARMLKDYIQGIRTSYTKDFACKDVTKRQIAVATYLIDKLALRAGNEKDDDEADTVGCCTLKVENVEPLPPNILKFDFLGKDSIRYLNEVEVELPVYKAIQQFRSGKKDADDLFDKLDTSKLNAHLKGLMPGLTAKVFRTYNASITLDDMLNKETKGGDLPEKVKVYNHANKEVAIICNHQRTVSKSHSAQMLKLNEKIDELKGVLEELKEDLSRAKKGKPLLKGADGKPKKNLNPEALERKIAQTTQKIEKMEHDKETKEDLKTVALGTSKINYLDPRITVAWCKRHEVPIDKMFNKSLLAKFSWAMDVDPSFRF